MNDRKDGGRTPTTESRLACGPPDRPETTCLEHDFSSAPGPDCASRQASNLQEPGPSRIDAGELAALRIEYLYGQIRMVQAGTAVATCFTTLVMWDAVSQSRLVSWLCLCTLVFVGRWILSRAYRSSAGAAKKYRPWVAWYTAMTVASGLCWGSAAFLLFPNNSWFHQSFLTLVAVTLSIASTYGAAPLRRSQLGFLAIVLAPFTVRYLYAGGTVNTSIGFSLLALMAALAPIAHRISATITDSLKGTLEVQSLVKSLTEEKAKAEQLNQDLLEGMQMRLAAEEELRKAHRELETRVEERTAQLSGMNGELETQILKRRQIEERYRTLVELAPVAIYISTNNSIVFVNSMAVKILSARRAEEVVGKSLMEFMNPAIRESVAQQARSMLEEWKPAPMVEIEFNRLDGARGWVEVRFAPIVYKGLESIMAVAADITERKRWEERIQATLNEKEVLLREIHHRVKNNLQIMSSLLDLQCMHVKDEDYRRILKDAENRIWSMALVHETLYESQDLARINSQEYIHTLLADLRDSYGLVGNRITMDVGVQELCFGIDAAVPVGLLINELVSNSLKHAFPGERQGTVGVFLSAKGDSAFELVVKDNGIGMPADVDVASNRSFGLRLVRALVEQLHGELRLRDSEGTVFEVQFTYGSTTTCNKKAGRTSPSLPRSG